MSSSTTLHLTFFILSFEKEGLTGPGAHQFTWFTGQWALGATSEPLSWPSQPRDYEICCPFRFLCGCWDPNSGPRGCAAGSSLQATSPACSHPVNCPFPLADKTSTMKHRRLPSFYPCSWPEPGAFPNLFLQTQSNRQILGSEGPQHPFNISLYDPRYPKSIYRRCISL